MQTRLSQGQITCLDISTSIQGQVVHQHQHYSPRSGRDPRPRTHVKSISRSLGFAPSSTPVVMPKNLILKALQTSTCPPSQFIHSWVHAVVYPSRSSPHSRESNPRCPSVLALLRPIRGLQLAPLKSLSPGKTALAPAILYFPSALYSGLYVSQSELYAETSTWHPPVHLLLPNLQSLSFGLADKRGRPTQ